MKITTEKQKIIFRTGWQKGYLAGCRFMSMHFIDLIQNSLEYETDKTIDELIKQALKDESK